MAAPVPGRGNTQARYLRGVRAAAAAGGGDRAAGGLRARAARGGLRWRRHDPAEWAVRRAGADGAPRRRGRAATVLTRRLVPRSAVRDPYSGMAPDAPSPPVAGTAIPSTSWLMSVSRDCRRPPLLASRARHRLSPANPRCPPELPVPARGLLARIAPRRRAPDLWWGCARPGQSNNSDEYAGVAEESSKQPAPGNSGNSRPDFADIITHSKRARAGDGDGMAVRRVDNSLPGNVSWPAE